MTASQNTGPDALAEVTSLAEARARRRGAAGADGGEGSASARQGAQRTAATAALRGPVTSSTERSAETEAQNGARASRGTRRANNVAIHQLARRGMSRWELAQVLERRGVADEVAEAELDRLESVGLIDDAALAVTIVRTHHTRKGRGRAALRQELSRRHIDASVADDALEELGDDEERERALELAHRRARQLSGLDERTAQRRLAGYLARKGYESEVVWASVRAALAEQEVPRHTVRFE